MTTKIENEFGVMRELAIGPEIRRLNEIFGLTKTMVFNDPQWAGLMEEQLNLVAIILRWEAAYFENEFIEDDSPHRTTEKD
jgi:hypothetical protein